MNFCIDEYFLDYFIINLQNNNNKTNFYIKMNNIVLLIKHIKNLKSIKTEEKYKS